eukprot:1086392-Amphidinium_carterae.1
MQAHVRTRSPRTLTPPAALRCSRPDRHLEPGHAPESLGLPQPRSRKASPPTECLAIQRGRPGCGRNI